MNLFHTTERRGVVAVIQRHDEFLVIRRSRFVSAPRMICFPGGGIESGETDVQALQREMREELHVQARAIRPIWNCQSMSGVALTWWQAELLGDQPLQANPSEVESFTWMNPQTMLAHPDLLPTNRDFLHALLSDEVLLQ